MNGVDALWFLGRGTGVMALLLLTVTVALGIATSAGRPLPGLPRFAVTMVHRNASLLAVAFLAVHLVSLLFDPYAQLRVADLVLPFAGAYRPLWLGLGTLAFDVLLAVVATSLLRHRVGLRSWRAVHWLAYAAWPMALAHGLGTGSDSWLWAPATACVLTVGVAAWWRWVPTASPHTAPTTVAHAALTVAPRTAATAAAHAAPVAVAHAAPAVAPHIAPVVAPRTVADAVAHAAPHTVRAEVRT